MFPKALEVLIEELGKLPGVGPRTAERYALYVLRMPKAYSHALAVALENLHDSIQSCRICHNLGEEDVCAICASSKRDESTVAVVEEPLDVLALEKTGSFRGLYHVLGGVISPLDGIGPSQLNMATLAKRLKQPTVKELIIATNPTTEGEATALYIQRNLVGTRNIKITRLARGLPMGSDLEYADQITLGRALEGRELF